MASINIPGNFNYFNSTTSININSLTYSDNLQSERLTFIEKRNTIIFQDLIYLC